MRSRLTRCVIALVSASVLFATSVEFATASAPEPVPLVVIDPGHGGRYSNANANGLREKNVNLAIARELRLALLARGYRVLMTRYTDRAVRLSDTPTWNYKSTAGTWSFARDHRTGYVGGIPKDDLQARVDYANARGADLFISLHANGASSRSARGTETYASPRDYLGRRLAPIVNREIVSATGLRNRGAHTADFYVCRWSNMPAILVETAFISSPRDAYLLKQTWFRRRVARGIANGVDSWMATEPYRRVYPRIESASSAELAERVSMDDFPYGAPVAVVARSSRAADVPGAAGLAVRLGGPLLWTGPSGPTTSTAAELARLAPQRLVVTGVDGSFDATAVAALAEASGVPTSAVEIKVGVDAAAVSASIAASIGVPASGEILVVRPGDTHSKMIAAAAGAAKGLPVLVTRDATLGPDVEAWLVANRPSIRRTVAVGGAARFAPVVSSGLPGVVRIEGDDYAHVAARLNARYFRSTSWGATRPVVTTICSNVQYLAAATYAGRRNQPVAPVWGRVLPVRTREWITNRRGPIGGFEVLTNGSVPLLMDRSLAKSDVR